MQPHQASPGGAGLPCPSIMIVLFCPNLFWPEWKQTWGRRQGTMSLLSHLLPDHPVRDSAVQEYWRRGCRGGGEKGRGQQGSGPLPTHLLAATAGPPLGPERIAISLPPHPQVADNSLQCQAKAAISCRVCTVQGAIRETEQQPHWSRAAFWDDGGGGIRGIRSSGARGRSTGLPGRKVKSKNPGWVSGLLVTQSKIVLHFISKVLLEGSIVFKRGCSALLKAGSKEELGQACPGGCHAPGRTGLTSVP